jgi:hypothetical protein
MMVAMTTQSLVAQQYGKRATIKIRDGEGRRITVSIDGKRFPQNGKILTIGDVPTGMHKIKVYLYQLVANNYAPNNGYNNNNRNMATAKLIYSGRMMAKPGTIYRCTVDDFEGMSISEYCCNTNNNLYFNYNDNTDQYYDNDVNWSDAWNGIVDNTWNNNNQNNQWNHQDGDHDHHDYNNNQNNYNNNNQNNYNNNNQNNPNNYNNNPNAYSPNSMNATSFANFKRTIQNSSFDSSKETLVKSQLANNWITSSQLIEIVELFSFESGKLDIAKFGATRVIDRNNLFNVYNSFTFESSKTEFANFISTLK